MTDSVFIHESAYVSTSDIGPGTNVWQFVVVLSGAKIGRGVNICAHCFIENDVVIGDRVTIKSGVQLWDGLVLEDDVFVGPNVTFCNDRFPRSKHRPAEFLQTKVRAGASVSAGATVLPGIEIGENAMVGAGSVVTRSVPPNAVVVGSPARIIRYLTSQNDSNSRATDIPISSQADQSSYPVGVGNVAIYTLKLVKEIEGKLSVGEFSGELPFEPERFFTVFDVPSNQTRGEHAHYACHQFLLCVKGHCNVVVDDGKSSHEIRLDSPNIGVYMPPMIWGTQYNYSPDAVLLVFASEIYDPEDYIRDYTEFCSLVKNIKFLNRDVR